MVKRILLWALGIVAALILVAVIGLLVLTNSDWGRSKVRDLALSALKSKAHGIVSLGRVSGDLLHGVTIHDIAIRDSSGAPFIIADEASTKYGIWALLHHKLAFSDLRLVRPLIVLDRPPNGIWNFKRIFPPSPPTGAPSAWGSYIVFDNVTIVDGRLIVRTPWHSADSLTGAARDSAIRVALGGGTRAHVIRAPGGFQKVSDFRQLDATLPTVRLAEPNTDSKLIQVASMSSVAYPFNPPAADIRDVKGKFYFTGDSLWFSGARARLPGSEISGSGRYVFAVDEIQLALRGTPASLPDLRWIYPNIPSQGQGTLDFAMLWKGDSEVYVARNASVRSEGATVSGDFGITLTDTMALHGVNLRFANLDTHLLEQLFPQLHIPRRGTLTGRAAVSGGKHALQMNADVAFDDRATGVSRVAAVGMAGMGLQRGVRARNLRLTLKPVQMALIQAVDSTFPIGGTLSGTATVDGSTASELIAHADLVHDEGGAESRLTGRGIVRLAGTSTWMDIDARAHPIALAVVGRFAPSLGLHGDAAGPIRLRGTLANLAVRSRLALPEGGMMTAQGTLDLQGATKRYDLALGARVFDAHAVLLKAPATSLTLRATAVGAGFSPATMRARFTADIAASRVDSIAIDSASIRVAIADGELTAERVVATGPYARATVTGTFGLVAGRTGTLHYSVALDSLRRVSRFLPAAQPGTVVPRPARRMRVLARARRDSARIAKATEVERAATGAPPPTLAAVDTPTVVPRDSIAGAVYAAGTISGSLQDFDIRGRAGARGLVYNGNTARNLRAEYGWFNARTPASAVALALNADSVSTAGFGFDSVLARVTYRKPGGTAQIVIQQLADSGPGAPGYREYAAAGSFTLRTNANELRLNSLSLQFDTTRWAEVVPAIVQWGGNGIVVQHVDLRDGHGGRIYVNGLLPTKGAANLQVAVAGFQVGNLLALLQSDIPLTGLVSVDATMQGTLAAPRLRGAFGLSSGTYGGTAVPDLHGTLSYADALLVSHAEAMRGGGAPLAVVDARFPIDLALRGVTGSRILDRPMRVDLVADSLPLELIPQFVTAVSNVHGRAAGSIALRGTPRAPRVAGGLVVDRGAATIVAAGVTVHSIAGTLRMRGDTVVIDSLVGISGGPARLTGTIGVATLRNPVFDLHLVATNVHALDNEYGQLRADAQLAMTGPFDNTLIDGSVNVRNGVIQLPESQNRQVISAGDPSLFNVIDTSLAISRQLVQVPSAFMQHLRMNVNVRVNRDTWVRRSDVNVEIYGNVALHMNRATNSLAVEGVINSDRGEYTFLSKRFTITRGSATFIGAEALNPQAKIDPTLQATGEYLVQLPTQSALHIQILVGGTLQAPRITLQSDAQPPIPQSDLLSYLAFGRSSSSLLQLEGSSTSGTNPSGGLVGAGAALATQKLAAVALGVGVQQLETEASRTFGTDVFNITPADLQTEFWKQNLGGFLMGTQVEAGKYTDPNTFFLIQARPTVFAFGPGNPHSTPGVSVTHRIAGGYSLQAAYDPRFLVTPPNLETPTNPKATGVFGLFLIREWKW